MRRAAIALTIAAVLVTPGFLGAATAQENDYVDVTPTTVTEQVGPEQVRGVVVTPDAAEAAEPQAQRGILPVTGSDAAVFLLGGAAALGLAVAARRMARRAAPSGSG